MDEEVFIPTNDKYRIINGDNNNVILQTSYYSNEKGTLIWHNSGCFSNIETCLYSLYTGRQAVNRMKINEDNRKAIKSIEYLKEYCKKCCEKGCQNCMLGKGDECFNEGNHHISIMPCDWKTPAFVPVLLEDEKVILKRLYIEYKWLVGGYGEDVYIYEDKPIRTETGWENKFNGEQKCLSDIFPGLFAWVTWEDEEPWYIPDLLKEE